MPEHAVLFTRKLPEAVERRAARDYRLVANPDDRPLSADELVVRCQDMDAVVCTVADRMNAGVLLRLPARVRIVASFGVGTEHLDLDTARARGLVVTNTPEVLTDATAEVALLLLLGAARRAYEGQALLRSGGWSGWAPTQLMGRQLSGKRLGIVGMGRIGQAMARRARGFGVEIHYTDQRRLPPEREDGAIFHPTVEELLPLSELLSLHAPSTPETRHLLDARRLGLLPPGAIVVNTARGDLVDDEALIAALRSGQVGAAGLDVFQGEPALHPAYRSLQNTFLLPHMGSATIETREAMGFRALDNVDAVLSGKPAPDRVA
ncbi:MAG TPA: D-glycerate dehydrogenase [Myxococcaceae bacterium]|nr:D-glycerate dehydrogenase [Myxococcaceae bacterium]